MIVTEEEAKTKRCQESFGPPLSDTNSVILSQIAVAVMQATHTSPAYCIGSDCMAWRWHKAYIDGVVQVRDPPRGYCGKAGGP